MRQGTVRSDPRRVLQWPPGSTKFRLLAGILLGLFGAYAATFLVVTGMRMIEQPASGDFFALWSAARFIVERPAAEVYDPALLKEYQIALGMSPGTNYPFPYPPSFLLPLWPLGLLPYLAAYIVAIGTTLVLYLWATVGARWRSPMALAALVAPTTTITIVAGQAGFLAAALLIGGFRLAACRPALAGVLFGLATYKPQMGVLVPVALAAAGLWRTIAAAIVTVAALAAATSLVFGLGIWPAWAVNIWQYSQQFAAGSSAILHLMPTVMGNLERLGASPGVAGVAQLVAAAIAVIAVWRCFRRGPGPVAAAALFVAAFLATPHAFVYDMPILATAVLWTIAERYRAGGAFGTGEVFVMILAMIAPITLVSGESEFPLALLSLVLLLAVIVRRCERLGGAVPPR